MSGTNAHEQKVQQLQGRVSRQLGRVWSGVIFDLLKAVKISPLS